MSLLNSALREAEERQRRPEVTPAYTGAVQEGRSGHRWLVLLVVLLALGLGGGLFWFFSKSPSRPAPEAMVSNATSAGDGKVERVLVAEEKVVVPQPPEPAQAIVTETRLSGRQSSDNEVSDETDSEDSVAENTVAAVSVPEVSPSEVTEPEVTQPEVPKSQKPASPEKDVQTASAPEPAADVAAPEPAAAPAVKTTPQSPGAIDRQTAKDLQALIAEGRMVEAERRLASLTRAQTAPRSRLTVARALLVDGDIQRALSWLPADLTASDSGLRMLRARALHADGRLDAAVSTLISNVPAVSDQPEYRVTLATLLQQQGQGQEAARHWAELIAWDDSRAPWWVGLAIALEDQGETRSATRAYEQAVALPGLSPSLADYVRRRLQSLRAG